MLLPPLPVPSPPLNISYRIVHLRQGAEPDGSQESGRSLRRGREVPLMEEEELRAEDASLEAGGASTAPPFTPLANLTGATEPAPNATVWAEPQSDWQDAASPSPSASASEEEFVNAVVSEYEDSNEPGSAMGLGPPDPPEGGVLPTSLPPLLLELRWLPPRPPTAYDGFNLYIYRDGRRVILDYRFGLSEFKLFSFYFV